MLLVTGGSGFVGSRVVALARRRGVPTTALARRAAAGIDYTVDLAAPGALAAVSLDDVTTVIHCAAAVPARSQAFARDNVAAAEALASAVRGASRVRRLIHVSSVSVYVPPAAGDWRIDEEAAVVDAAGGPAPSYAQSKREVERALDALASAAIEVVHLRASSVYGPGMVPTTLLPVLVGRARRGEPLILHGPRGYRQNFVHVDDVAELALAAAESGGPAVVNAFSEDTLGIVELADLVRSRLHSTSPVVDETSPTVVPTPHFVNDRARELLPVFRTLREHLGEASE